MLRKTFFITLLILLFFPLITGALSYPLVPCGQKEDNPSSSYNETEPCTICHFFQLIKNVIDFFLIDIVPPLVILMIAVAGFLYIFAYLNPEGTILGTGGPGLISRANQIFGAVVGGLIIIYGAWILTAFFFEAIGVAQWTNLEAGWWQIRCETGP